MRGALGMVPYDSRAFVSRSGGAAKLNQDARARGRCHHGPHYGAVLV